MSKQIDDLTQQLAAAIMDCLTFSEGADYQDDGENKYCWGDDRSQIYVDVASMARVTAYAWKLYGIRGIIYEVSECVADEAYAQRRVLTRKEILALLKKFKGVTSA